MKKTVVLFALLVLGFVAKSQMTLIHSFDGYPKYCGWEIGDIVTVTDLDPCYLLNIDNTYYFYDWNFILQKTITITKMPEDYKIGSVYFSRKIFNNNEEMEILVIYSANTPQYQYPDVNFNQKVWVIDENNHLIQDVTCSYSMMLAPVFHKNGEEIRCQISKLLNNEDGSLCYKTDIYRCAGNGGNSVSIPEKSISNMNAYPNPAGTTITLPYNLKSNAASEMRIYDIQGRLVRTINVGPHFNEINLNVSDFPSGVYIYECDGVSNKFIVE